MKIEIEEHLIEEFEGKEHLDEMEKDDEGCVAVLVVGEDICKVVTITKLEAEVIRLYRLLTVGIKFC